MNKRKGSLLIIFSSLLYGSYGLWSRLMGDSFGVFYQSWTRALIIALILFPIVFIRKEIVPIEKKDRKWMSIYLFVTAFTLAPIYYAFNHMDIGMASIIFFGSMLLTMYSVGFIFLGEKLTKVKAIACLIAFTGLFLTFSFSISSFSLLAASMAVLNGIASGAEVSFSKKLSGNYSSLYVVWIPWIVIFLTNLPLSIMLGEVQHVPTFSVVWLYQLGYVFAGLVGFWAVVEGLKYVESSVGGLIGLLEIVFGIAFGVIVFHEILTLRSVFGALLVLTAAALPHIHELYVKRFETR